MNEELLESGEQSARPLGPGELSLELGLKGEEELLVRGWHFSRNDCNLE